MLATKQPTEMTGIKAIKVYFEQDDGRRVSLDELKTLSLKDRQELAELAAVELGVKLKPYTPIPKT